MKGPVWCGAAPPLARTLVAVLDSIAHDSIPLVALTWTNQ